MKCVALYCICPFYFTSTPAVLAPLTDPTVCEEQIPLQERSVAQAPSSQKYQPSPSELPFGQQDAHPTFFGPLTIDPSLPPDPLSHPPPAADPRLGACWVCMCVMLQIGPCVKVQVAHGCTIYDDKGLIRQWVWVYTYRHRMLWHAP